MTSPHQLRPPTFLIALLAVMLAACAPAPATTPVPRATATLTPDTPTYYPHQTGLTWTYLTEGDSTLTPPYTLTVLGPSITDGQRVILTRLRGRGLDITYYHQHDNTGVHLLREDRTDHRITYHPPIQELPRDNALAPGVTWGGATTATITHTNPNQPPTTRHITYQYTVLEQRPATTPAGQFDTYTIELQAHDDTGSAPTRQHAWFTPHLGYTRLKNDLILTSTNTQGRQ